MAWEGAIKCAQRATQGDTAANPACCAIKSKAKLD
jgi:hypothetical protein